MPLGRRNKNKKENVKSDNVSSFVGLFKVLLFVGILSFAIWSMFKGPDSEVLYKEAISDLNKYQGTELFLSYAPVIKASKTLIVVEQYNTLVPVRLPIDTKISSGDFLSFRGQLNQELEIEASKWHIHRNRNEKYWLSLIPLFVLGFYFYKKGSLST